MITSALRGPMPGANRRSLKLRRERSSYIRRSCAREIRIRSIRSRRARGTRCAAHTSDDAVADVAIVRLGRTDSKLRNTGRSFCSMYSSSWWSWRCVGGSFFKKVLVKRTAQRGFEKAAFRCPR